MRERKNIRRARRYDIQAGQSEKERKSNFWGLIGCRFATDVQLIDDWTLEKDRFGALRVEMSGGEMAITLRRGN